MAAHEAILLRRFVEHRDAEAFSEIVRHYADPVFNTCRRILFDEASAADAAQETFYQLMCSAGSIRGSLSGWLHSVATKKAISAIRRSSSRRLRERRYALKKGKEVNQWKDISPYIDEALDSLAPEYRALLIQYFFEGQTMSQIAAEKRVSQPTISRMVNIGIEELRKRFKKQGIIVSGVVLGLFLKQNTLHAAPAFLMTEVGKMSLVGTTTGVLTSSAGASSAAAASAGSVPLSSLFSATAKTGLNALLSTARAKVAAAVAISIVGTGAVITYNFVFNSGQDETPAATVIEAAINNDKTAEPLMDGSNQPIILNQVSTGGGFGGFAASGDEREEIPINLADPEATIDTFTELLVTDNLDLWKKCFTPDSETLVKLNRIMNQPANVKEQQLQNAFNSIGQPVEILELLETEEGLSIKLLYTVYDSFSIDTGEEKLTLQEYDQFEVHAELVSLNEEWKISKINAVRLPLLSEGSL